MYLSLARQLHHGPGSDIVCTCAQVVAKLKQLQADAETIVAFLSNESAVQQLKQDKAYNLRFLQDVRNVPPRLCHTWMPPENVHVLRGSAMPSVRLSADGLTVVLSN